MCKISDQQNIKLVMMFGFISIFLNPAILDADNARSGDILNIIAH